MAAQSDSPVSRFTSIHIPYSISAAPKLSRGILITVLGVLLMALAPRLIAPGEFVTTDEARHWMERSENFLHAIQGGDFAATNQTGHPGVTTMWLGASGILLHDAVSPQPATAVAELTSPAEFVRVLLFMRLPVALVTALSAVLAYLLLTRLFDQPVALLAALFLVADPFLLAHGRLLHLDGLLTAFMSLSLLAALVAFRLGDHDAAQAGTVRRGLLAASGTAAGLAFLTKSPSVLLLPMIGLIGLVGLVGVLRLSGLADRKNQAVRLLASLLLWGGAALAVCLLLWPALWVDPSGAVMAVVNEVIKNGGEPHAGRNFFLGQVVSDPGPLFYPVALTLRLAPWTMLGMLAAAFVLPRRHAGGALWGSTAINLLIVFVLLFLLLLSVPPKKFDRYILPVFPVLNIIAAVGWVRLVRCLLKSANQEAGRVRRLEPLAYPLIAAGLLVYTFWYQPYHLAHYNPLAGGGAVAQRAIYVGWGEGLAQAARYINAQPGPYGCGYPMAVDYNWVMEHYACAPVRHISQVNLTGNVAYSVLYINQVQRNLYTETSHLLQTHGSLVHTVRLHGIDYARIYQLPLPVEHTITADFGSSIRLVGYSLDSSALRSTGVLTLTVQWQARQPVEEDVMLFVHVLDEQGRRVAQVDVPLAGPQMPTHMWQAGHYYQWAHPLPVGAEQAAGTSWLAAGLYHPDTAERLPLQAPAPSGRLDYGSDALVLPPVTLLP